MEKIYSYEQLKKRLREFDSIDERVVFLKKYLSEDSHISAENSAVFHEVLGDLQARSAASDGEVFEKAASAWEQHWASHELYKIPRREQRKTLRRAILNYKLAADIYAKQGSKSLQEEARNKAAMLVDEMASHHTPVNFFFTILAGISFVFSILFLSQSFTGLAVADISPERSFWIGGALIFIAFVLIWALVVARKQITKLI